MRIPKPSRLSIKLLKTVIPAVLLFSVLSFKCKSTKQIESADPSLELIASYELKIKEPSGITFNGDYTACWIVDGDDQVVYKTDLEGNILEKLNYKGEDLEGIFFDRRDQTLWVAEEDLRQLVQLDMAGNELKRMDTDILGTRNKGLEGIARDTSTFYVVNEKKPVSVYALDKDFKSARQYEINFARDLSDIVFEPQTNTFYIISDESKAVFIWTPADGRMKKYALPFEKGEGIAVNTSTKTFLIVNDELNTLYEFRYK